jgi:hypothetical protein
MLKIKVDILLPKRDRNKIPIDGKKFTETYDEIYDEFGGCTMDNSPLLGSWFNTNTLKRDDDESISYWVIYNDTYSSAFFLDEMKSKLKDRFKQDEILMYSSIVNFF